MGQRKVVIFASMTMTAQQTFLLFFTPASLGPHTPSIVSALLTLLFCFLGNLAKAASKMP